MILRGSGDPRLMTTVKRDRVVGAGLVARRRPGGATTDRAQGSSQASARASSEESSSCRPHYNPLSPT
jgi:hypothetical protein